MPRRIDTALAIGTCLVSVGTAAHAQTVLQFDINALSAEASGNFSENFTGSFDVFNTPSRPDFDGDAKILDVLIDGVAQETGGADAEDFAFAMTLSFDDGFLTGGDIMLAVDENGSENTYTATVSPSDTRSILNTGGGVFLLGGLTFDGMFTDPDGTMLGVGVEPWGGIQPVPGFFSQIEFTPNADNRDEDTDVDVFVLVPTPMAAAMGALGLGGLALRRRR